MGNKEQSYLWIKALRQKVKEVWSMYHGGLLEGVYQDAVSLELEMMGIDAPTEIDIPIYHKGIKLKHSYRADMIICDEVLVEFKACKEIIAEHRAQLYNYMRLTGKQAGVLVNFSQTCYLIETYWLDIDKNKIDFFNK